MKLRYLNGEKVYVHDGFKHDISIWKHSDVVRIINGLFQQAEREPDAVGSPLFSLLYALEACHVGLPFEKINGFRKEIVFDDAGKIRLAKEPRLRAGKKVNPEWSGKPYVVKGGQHKPVPPREEIDALTADFRSFLARERGGESAGNEVTK